MTINQKDRIQEFERLLDKTLEALPSLLYDGEACLRFALDFIDVSYATGKNGAAAQFVRGLNILAPYFIDHRAGPEPDVNQLVKDLFFAGNYFMMREYFYYTYNAEGSFSWVFEGDQVTVSFNDPTIPRQFFIQENNFVLRSMEVFAEYDNTVGEIQAALKGRDEFTHTPDLEPIGKLLEKETELKLSAYYNFIDPEDEVDLGGYSYRQYYLVFKALVTKALYHRYHSQVNDSHGSISAPVTRLISDLSEDTGLPEDVCASIIDDITYSPRAKKERLEPVYFALFQHADSDSILLSPHILALWEGLINILRITAIRRPRIFLANLSDRLGANFTDYTGKLFSGQGFKCKKNVQLAKFDPGLPDIDLLVISEEPTFGYVLFCCETKNPIPPQWAKDHLKVLNKDSVAKAFTQLDRIGQFFASEEGVGFIRGLLPEGGLPHFGEGFLVSTFFVIVTSVNAGMFFGDRNRVVVDYHTLERLLNRCDGDVLYLMRGLKEFGKAADERLNISSVNFVAGSKNITYQVTQVRALLDFEQNQFKSIGADKEMTKQFIEDGHHPLDTLEYLAKGTNDKDDE